MKKRGLIVIVLILLIVFSTSVTAFSFLDWFKTTFHLDWGYLEIWVELGLFGLIAYALVLISIFYQGWQTIKKLKKHVFEKRLVIGLLAGLASLIMASLTGPFLFHPIGIFYLVLTAAIIISIKEDEFKIDNSNCYLE